MEIQAKKFELKETLNKWKFLEKDPIREKQFILLLRKYKRLPQILQSDPLFEIKINYECLLKEIKVKILTKFLHYTCLD